MKAAERAKTPRHPTISERKPEIGRASRMPTISPLMTLPTVRPRFASSVIEAASGTSIWMTLEEKPMNSAAPRKGRAVGAKAVSTSATEVTATAMVISFLFSTMSPSGTSSTRPQP